MALSVSLEQHILNYLDQFQTIPNSLEFKHNDAAIDQQILLGVLNRLLGHQMVQYETHDKLEWVLTEEGEDLRKLGSHEARVYKSVPETGISVDDLTKLLGDLTVKIGSGKAFKNKWIKKDGELLVRNVAAVTDDTQIQLQNIYTSKTESELVLKDLKKRKLIDKVRIVWFSIKKGPNFSLKIEEQATDLTSEMLQNETWKTLKFKDYNLAAQGIPVSSGHLHPLMKIREEIRNIFLYMGFEEMPTNNYVESSFWNFDSLFQPQQHPARDAHDTFFIQDPEKSVDFPADYLEKVKAVHSKGGYGSVGYRYDWDIEEAKKNILRTHTTAVSSRMLYKLAQKPFKPAKYFSIDKVFRNESVDATHLAEFHQVEGVIADYDLTLGHLLGVLSEFFTQLGLKDLEFKPAYNPYTEPSMEVFAYHEGLGKRIEVGNSGVFRPEMLLPMGFEPNVTVIAWGLSLERPAMIKYGIRNIRSLVGHKVELDMIKTNPICRIDK